MHSIPYWRLSWFYFMYFAAVGVISPYWSVYLDEIGFSGEQIGLLVALPMVTRVIAPNLWGAVADRTGAYRRVIQFGAFAAVVLFSGLFWAHSFWTIVLFSCLYTFFWTAILPQFEVLTLDFLSGQAHRYSRIRLWGSIGFIVAVAGLGVLFEWFSARLLLWVMWGLLLGIFAMSLIVPVPPSTKLHSRASDVNDGWWRVLAQPHVRRFLLAAVLLHMSHGAFYSFYSLFLLENDYSNWLVGCLWSVGVMAEILLFLKAPAILGRFSLLFCFALSTGAAALRWWLLGFWVESLVIVIVTQLLHALTFGLAHSAAIEFVRTEFPGSMRGKAQAFYGAVCFGGGGAIGAYISGLVWSVNQAGSFGVSGAMAAIGLLVLLSR